MLLKITYLQFSRDVGADGFEVNVWEADAGGVHEVPVQGGLQHCGQELELFVAAVPQDGFQNRALLCACKEKSY